MGSSVGSLRSYDLQNHVPAVHAHVDLARGGGLEAAVGQGFGRDHSVGTAEFHSGKNCRIVSSKCKFKISVVE